MGLRAGLIGCGGLGKVHTEALQQLDGMKMVAFGDIIEERAEEFATKYSGEYGTTDTQRIIEDPSIDAIYICTQHDSHADLCIRSLDAGKHVMVEKPLALTVEECLAVGEAVKRNEAILMTAFKMRYYEMIQKAKELIPEPLIVVMQMMDNRWPDEIWPNDPIKGGGNVLSQGCHSCDILRYMAGSNPIGVYAGGGNYYQKSGVVDNLAAVFRFENSMVGSWIQGDSNSPPLTSKFFLEAFAEGKSLTLLDRLCTLTYSENGREPQVFRGIETGFLEENRAFIEAIKTQTSPPIDHIDGLYATLMVLQAFKSLKSGRPEPIASLVEA
jgi:predicted dehydrogenase